MTIDTVNRMARGLDFPDLVGPDSISLVTAVTTPGSSFQNQNYGDSEVGNRGLGDFSVIGDYFTSENYYIGYVAIGLLAYTLLFSSGGKRAARQLSRRASLKGAIARETELLKGA